MKDNCLAACVKIICKVILIRSRGNLILSWFSATSSKKNFMITVKEHFGTPVSL